MTSSAPSKSHAQLPPNRVRETMTFTDNHVQSSAEGSEVSTTSCEGCKLSKVKCDSQRPECHRCLRRAMTCYYPARKRPGRRPTAVLPVRRPLRSLTIAAPTQKACENEREDERRSPTLNQAPEFVACASNTSTTSAELEDDLEIAFAIDNWFQGTEHLGFMSPQAMPIRDCASTELSLLPLDDSVYNTPSGSDVDTAKSTFDGCHLPFLVTAETASQNPAPLSPSGASSSTCVAVDWDKAAALGDFNTNAEMIGSLHSCVNTRRDCIYHQLLCQPALLSLLSRRSGAFNMLPTELSEAPQPFESLLRRTRTIFMECAFCRNDCLTHTILDTVANEIRRTIAESQDQIHAFGANNGVDL